jgi:hypothetical protein
MTRLFIAALNGFLMLGGTAIAQSVAAAASPAAEASAKPTGADATPPPADPFDESHLTPEQADALQKELIKESQNPVGNIAVIPFQNNWNYGFGLFARTQYNLNIEPVVPFEITPNLSLVARTIIPLLNQPSPLSPAACNAPGGCPWTFGLSDIQEQLYFAPKVKEGAVICGAGSLFYLPTATPGGLGSGKTSVGPTAVALIMPGRS